jgi:hypothetical protein
MDEKALMAKRRRRGAAPRALENFIRQTPDVGK